MTVGPAVVLLGGIFVSLDDVIDDMIDDMIDQEFLFLLLLSCETPHLIFHHVDLLTSSHLIHHLLALHCHLFFSFYVFLALLYYSFFPATSLPSLCCHVSVAKSCLRLYLCLSVALLVALSLSYAPPSPS